MTASDARTESAHRPLAGWWAGITVPRRRVLLVAPDPPPRAAMDELDRAGVDLLTVADVAACLERLRFSAWYLCVVCTGDADAGRVQRLVHDEEIGVRVLSVRLRKQGGPREDVAAFVLKALARCDEPLHRGLPLEIAGLYVDPAGYEVRFAGQRLELKRQQFRLLYLLALRAPQALRRAELVAQLQGAEGACSLRNVDTLVCRLRQTLVAATGRSFVITVPGVGYRLDAQAPWLVSAAPAGCEPHLL